MTKEGTYPISECPIQYHLLCSLGQDWGHLCDSDQPRLPDGLVTVYTDYILGLGGAMTWEVPVDRKGLIHENFLRQLRLVKEFLNR